MTIKPSIEAIDTVHANANHIVGAHLTRYQIEELLSIAYNIDSNQIIHIHHPNGEDAGASANDPYFCECGMEIIPVESTMWKEKYPSNMLDYQL